MARKGGVSSIPQVEFVVIYTGCILYSCVHMFGGITKETALSKYGSPGRDSVIDPLVIL